MLPGGGGEQSGGRVVGGCGRVVGLSGSMAVWGSGGRVVRRSGGQLVGRSIRASPAVGLDG